MHGSMNNQIPRVCFEVLMVIMVLIAVTSNRFIDVYHSAGGKRRCDSDIDAQSLRQHADPKVGIHF